MDVEVRRGWRRGGELLLMKCTSDDAEATGVGRLWLGRWW